VHHVVVPVDEKKPLFSFHTKTATVSVRSTGYSELLAIFCDGVSGDDIRPISVDVPCIYSINCDLHGRPPQNVTIYLTTQFGGSSSVCRLAGHNLINGEKTVDSSCIQHIIKVLQSWVNINKGEVYETCKKTV
jgi:hypothetical protein